MLLNLGVAALVTGIPKLTSPWYMVPGELVVTLTVTGDVQRDGFVV